MTWLRWFRRQQADIELQQEIEAYIAEETSENMARGMSPMELGDARASNSGIRKRSAKTCGSRIASPHWTVCGGISDLRRGRCAEHLVLHRSPFW